MAGSIPLVVDDGLVVAVMTLVALAHSTPSIAARRSIWPGNGVHWASFTFCLRNLPRSRNESSVLAGAFVATAVAVSAYGLYQVKVELPHTAGRISAQSRPDLAEAQHRARDSGESMLKNRLMRSTEPWSTFALANSLAGFIAGPLVMLLAVGLYNLVRPEGRIALDRTGHGGPTCPGLARGLILSKSRSA